MHRCLFGAAAGLALCGFASASAPGLAVDHGSNRGLSADQRVALLLPQLTQAEKLSLVLGYFGESIPASRYVRPAAARYGSAGYVPGIERLGVPPQWQTDAGLGVATQSHSALMRERTALPSGLATAATWNPALAYQGGAMIGSEARKSGFNVMLAGGINLVRDPRDGRNFEYGGEDPLLAGVMVGQAVRGIQSNHIVATLKHFALNDQETGRLVLDAIIDPAQARMSDLLAFEIAIRTGDPGAVMCAYNRVDGRYACESDWLLNRVLKGDWAYPGYVMSDWGAVHSVNSALAGLDQESAAVFDIQPYFGEPLKAALAAGEVLQARMDDMARRILRSLFAHGVVDLPVGEAPIDLRADAAVTQAEAEEGMVLLKNEHHLLPLDGVVKTIAVIGSHADVGVLSGGGSSQVYPVGGTAVPRSGSNDVKSPVYFPSSPLRAVAARAPAADVRYDAGTDVAAAAALAARSDVVLLFARQWTTEGMDASLTLPDGQDKLIAAVLDANPRTVVILETGGPVLMPWLGRANAVLEAWYPGTRGGEGIARILFGEIAPSGRLPVSFPADPSQLPRPLIDGGDGQPDGGSFPVAYREGAAVGYKWYDKNRLEPLFAFGFGMTYTEFSYEHLKVRARGNRNVIDFDVRNTGARSAMCVPQVYVGAPPGIWEAPRRLAAWSKLRLHPGQTRHVSLLVPPRMFATFDSNKGWSIAAGNYEVSLAASSRDIRAVASVSLTAATLPVRWGTAR
jgi:beta-glucosidase